MATEIEKYGDKKSRRLEQGDVNRLGKFTVWRLCWTYSKACDILRVPLSVCI
jgi:hypothetical protein